MHVEICKEYMESTLNKLPKTVEIVPILMLKFLQSLH